jgi:hypothetical protein
MPITSDRFFRRPSPALVLACAAHSISFGGGVGWSAIASSRSPAEQEFVGYAISATVS